MSLKHNKINILVGTQSITKGYHFPKVTLVGVLWADLNLNFRLCKLGDLEAKYLAKEISTLPNLVKLNLNLK